MIIRHKIWVVDNQLYGRGLVRTRVKTDMKYCARIRLHPSDNPLLNSEESQQDIAQPPEDREDKLDAGLSGDQHQPGADQDPQVLQANSDRLATVAGPLDSQSLVLAPHPHREWTGKPALGLCLDPAPPGDSTQALPQGEDQQPSLAQVTPGGPGGDEAGGSGGSPPALVITQAEEVSKDTGPDGK
ncbi:hypothetical protein N1851_017567 [Merluccius polli]|uniref:Uncharacterized protein n=1 Tax=Merluccius polli TaxID=89951 RepID=A0AA47MQ02_MERPO|nr:hypothetical protein N1851_017567 [Merluccius polli]